MPSKRPAHPTECLLNARLLQPEAYFAHATSQYVCVFRFKGDRSEVEVAAVRVVMLAHKRPLIPAPPHGSLHTSIIYFTKDKPGGKLKPGGKERTVACRQRTRLRTRKRPLIPAPPARTSCIPTRTVSILLHIRNTHSKHTYTRLFLLNSNP